MATLETELKDFQTNALAKAPPAIIGTIQDWNTELSASGIVGQSLQAGQTAPDFALPNAHGRIVTLASLLAHGPVVVTFYRGA